MKKRFNRPMATLLIAGSGFLLNNFAPSAAAQVTYSILGTYGPVSESLTSGRYAAIDQITFTHGSQTQIYGQGSATVNVGEFTLTFSGARPQGYNQTVASYCVDLFQYSTTMTTVEARTFPTGALNENPYWDLNGGQKAAYLYNTYSSFSASQYKADTANECAALQVAIWKAVYGNAVTFSLTSAIQDLAFGAQGYYTSAASANWGIVNGQYPYMSTWLHSINPNGNPGGFGGYGQDFISPRIVPEPAEMAAVGIGLMAVSIGFSRYRMGRKTQGVSPGIS
jgi:hypothetical protein